MNESTSPQPFQRELFGRNEQLQLNRAILVHVDLSDAQHQEYFQEFIDLCDSAGAEVKGLYRSKRHHIDPKTFMGSGKAKDIADAVEAEQADVVIVNHSLTPSQERNLEGIFQCRVLDRVGLILDIFAQRARTHEGKLQVELAQLRHMSTRLIRGWSHLERQKGGIGMRGPGETQLETDRRLIGDKIKKLEAKIEKIRNQRQLSRRARQRNQLPLITIAGYTNAGKSTLFNRLSDAHVYEADRLFATLDATIRRIDIPGAGPVILADTVGFIRHIPHDLVAAFRSTLEETQQAELILHLIDIQDPEMAEKILDVWTVLDDIQAADIPQLMVLNKADALSTEQQQEKLLYVQALLEHESTHRESLNVIDVVPVSAIEQWNFEALSTAIGEQFKGRLKTFQLIIPAHAGRFRAQCYDLGQIEQESYDDEGNCHLTITCALSALNAKLADASTQGIKCNEMK